MASSDDPGRERRAVPAWLERAGAVGGRLLVLAVLLWLVVGFASRLTVVLVPILVALLLSGVAAPAVRWAHGKGVRREVGAAAVVGLLLAVLGGAAALLWVRISDQLPQLRDRFQQVSADLSDTLGIQLPWSGSSSGDSGSADIGALVAPARTAAEVLVGTFLTLALTFLFLASGPSMWQWILGKLGGQAREDADAAGRAAWTTVGGYVRGLTIVAVFDAVGIGVGLLLLGVPLALTLAVLQFLASYIPTLGALAAGAVAVGVAYGSGGLGMAAWVLLLVVAVQQIGNSVVEPWVMKNRLPLNAAVVLVAVTVGGILWGIAGALLFVPLAAAASAGGHELWERRGSRPIAGG